jgi:nitronate monooxygenase
MAGGPSTPALAAAVSDAGGLGFLAGGYKAVAALAAEIGEIRSRTSARFGVNLFVPSAPPVGEAALAAYLSELEPEAERYGVPLGDPIWSDDGWEAKVELVLAERPAVVSFTFGCPEAGVVERLHERGVAAWCTVTTPEEARIAAAAGVDALVVQGAEAGAHRGSFLDGDDDPLALLPLLRLVAAAVDLPLVAAGGIADGRGIAAVLAAGARAAQVGTAFLLCPEAGTSAVHRRALMSGGETALTRAFTGRRARGIVNRFLREHSAGAASAYPQIHYATAPLRAAAREAGDADGVNLWAGQAYHLAEASPAGELVRRWAHEARALS